MAGLLTSKASPGAGRAVLHHGGFTVVELIVIIVLIGIVSTIAVNRFFDRSSFDVDAWNEQARATVRYGQKAAIAQNRDVFVLLTPNRIALCFENNSACPAASQVPAPGGANNASAATRAACASASWMCAGRPDGVTMAVSVPTLQFDSLGRASAPGSAADAALTLTMGGDGSTRSMTVERETGYVN